MKKPDGIPMTEQIQNDDKRLKALAAYVHGNFPNGCDGIICRYCIFRDAGVDTPEEHMCEMLYGILRRE
jgi:hypothetical protein